MVMSSKKRINSILSVLSRISTIFGIVTDICYIASFERGKVVSLTRHKNIVTKIRNVCNPVTNSCNMLNSIRGIWGIFCYIFVIDYNPTPPYLPIIPTTVSNNTLKWSCRDNGLKWCPQEKILFLGCQQ